jgi:exopolysaccharide production protein ExoZ
VGDVSSSANKQSQFDCIQAMRAAAAALVFLLHSVSLAITYSNGSEMQTLYAIWSHIGHAGVDIFFVISGLIMFQISSRDIKTVHSSGRLRLSVDFFVRRAARIYPLYWITLAVMILVPSWWSNDWHFLALDRLLELHKHPMFILLWGQPSFDLVAWTLVYEMLFYISITILMLVGGAQFGTAVFCWCCFQAAFVGAAAIGTMPTYPISNPITLEFIMGVGLAYVISRGESGFTRLSIVLGSAMLIASMTFLDVQRIAAMPLLRVAGFALPATLILYGLISLERKALIRLPRPLVICGDISYSIYLWHLPVLMLLGCFVWTKVGLFSNQVGCFVYIATGIALTLWVSAVSYHLIERPMMKAAVTYYHLCLDRLFLACKTIPRWSAAGKNPAFES